MGENSLFFTNLIEKGEFRIDDKGHARLFGEYLFLIPPKVMVKLQNDLEEKIGHEEMSSLMKELGRYQVEQALDRYSIRMNFKDISKSKFLKFAQNIVKIIGWGEIEFKTLKKESKEAEIIINYPTFPEVYLRNHEPTETPICHYLNGILQEMVEKLIGEVELYEATCAVNHDSHVCVFKTK